MCDDFGNDDYGPDLPLWLSLLLLPVKLLWWIFKRVAALALGLLLVLVVLGLWQRCGNG